MKPATRPLRLLDEVHRPAGEAVFTDDRIPADLAGESLHRILRGPPAEERELDAPVSGGANQAVDGVPAPDRRPRCARARRSAPSMACPASADLGLEVRVF